MQFIDHSGSKRCSAKKNVVADVRIREVNKWSWSLIATWWLRMHGHQKTRGPAWCKGKSHLWVETHDLPKLCRVLTKGFTPYCWEIQ